MHIPTLTRTSDAVAAFWFCRAYKSIHLEEYSIATGICLFLLSVFGNGSALFNAILSNGLLTLYCCVRTFNCLCDPQLAAQKAHFLHQSWTFSLRLTQKTLFSSFSKAFFNSRCPLATPSGSCCNTSVSLLVGINSCFLLYSALGFSSAPRYQR